MLAQNIQAQNVKGIFSVIAGKMSSAASQDNTFEKLFATTTSKADTTAKSEITVQKATTTDTSGKETNSTNPTEVSEKQDVTKTEAIEKTASTTEMQETDTEYAEKVATLINQVVEVVQEFLNLTDEQFDSMLNQLGISQEELIDPNMLKEFYLLANQQSDTTVLLTDANLLANFKLLSEQVENLIQESGLSQEDLLQQFDQPEFMQLLEKVQDSMKQTATEQQPKEDIENSEDTQAPTVVTEHSEETKTLDISFKTETQSSETGTTTTEKKTDSTIENDATAEQFISQLQNAAEKVDSLTGTDHLQTEIREIANQILEQVRVVVKPEMTSLEIQLTPEHLGKVNLTVTEQDGVMTAKFMTENQLSKEAIESNLVQFKEMLQEQGLKVDSIEVTVSEFSFDKGNQAEQDQEGQQKGKRRFVMSEVEETKSVTDQIGLHFLEGGESTVNYMA